MAQAPVVLARPAARFAAPMLALAQPDLGVVPAGIDRPPRRPGVKARARPRLPSAV